MDPLQALSSPLWWLCVAAAAVALSATSALVLRLWARGVGGVSAMETTKAGQRLLASRRLRLWAAGLLGVANLAMLGVLTAPDLCSPRLAGPVGLGFLGLCFSTLTLSWLLWLGAVRAGASH
jgi:hypothetical protein